MFVTYMVHNELIFYRRGSVSVPIVAHLSNNGVNYNYLNFLIVRAGYYSICLLCVYAQRTQICADLFDIEF